MRNLLLTLILLFSAITNTYADIIVSDDSVLNIAETNVGAFSGGTGSAEDPYLISTAQDLVQLSTDVNAKNAYEGTFFKMTNDIDMSSVANFIPIGNNHGESSECKSFMGVFDGNNYTISNLVVDYQGKDRDYQGVALFGIVMDATVKNVRIENSQFIGYGFVSAVASVCFGSTIQNCHVADNVTVTAEMLGAAGISAAVMISKAVIEDCSSAATVTVISNQMGVASGILACVSEGGNGTIVRRCVNYGTITSDFDCCTGILSMIEYPAIVEDCANFGKIISQVGGTGIAYYATKPEKDCLIVKNSYNVGQIIGQQESNIDAVCLGNIFQGSGEENCKVDNCFFAEDTEGAFSKTATPIMSPEMKTQDFVNKLNNGRVDGPWHIIEGFSGGFPVPFQLSGSSDQGGGTAPDPEVPKPDVPHVPNTISINNTTALAGSQITIPVNLANTDSITAFQFDVRLPEGLTVAKDADGFEMIELSTERTTDKRHVIAFKEQTDGSLRVVSYSLKNLVFNGYSGPVVNITVNVDSNIKDGDYEIQITNVVLSKPSSERLEGPDTKSVITISSKALGDVNMDAVIDISDVVSIVSIIQGRPSSDVQLLLADVNKDTCIDVADIVALVNVILSQEQTPMTRLYNMDGNLYDQNLSMSIASLDNPSDNEDIINICLNNTGKDITALQFDLHLSDGISLKTDESGSYEIFPGTRTSADRHVFNCRQLNDGSYRIIAYSPLNSLFNGYSGDVISLALRGENVSVGNIMVKNIVVSDSDARSYRLAAAESSVTLDCPTVIELDNNSLNGADVYSIDGTLVKRNADNLEGLDKGVYIVNNKKIIK